MTTNQASTPYVDPQLGQDIKAIEIANIQLQQDKATLQTMVLMIKTALNPLQAAQDVLQMATNIQGDNVSVLSAVDNLASDLRADESTASNTFAGMQSSATAQQMDQWMSQIDGLIQFLQQQQALGSSSPLDQDNITNMLTALGSITKTFGNDWDNPTKALADFNKWMNQTTSFAQQIQTIENGMQTVDQSVSAFSTTTNTQLQVVSQNYTQLLGITNDAMKTYQELIGAFVKNQQTQ